MPGPSIARLSASVDPSEIVGVLERDGVVIVEDLLDADLLTRFNAELDPLLDAAALGRDRRFINDAIAWFFGTDVRHVSGVAGKSPIFAREILTHPLFMAVADVLLLPRCADYVLNIAHVLDRGPGADGQIPHRDELVWNDLPEGFGHVQLASVIALVDFTAENGATLAIPGSHRWPRDRVPELGEMIPAEMAAGSAVIYLGSTTHAGGRNTTDDQWRRGMHVSYCLGWLRTEENNVISTPLEVVRDLPRRNQQLLGYGAHDGVMRGGGYLGTVDIQDPSVLLADGRL